MVSEVGGVNLKDISTLVLILVLVEDGLGEAASQAALDELFGVLILVLVEDGLGVLLKVIDKKYKDVLILVLVEDGLGGYKKTYRSN